MNPNNQTGKWNRYNNCFGYAVNIPKWLSVEDYLDEDYYGDELFESFIHENAYQKLNLKKVNKKDMVLGKTYVAYRYCRRDFHFMKRLPTGHWRHKQGMFPVTAISQKEVFDKRGWLRTDGVRYNSRLYLFEVIE